MNNKPLKHNNIICFKHGKVDVLTKCYESNEVDHRIWMKCALGHVGTNSSPIATLPKRDFCQLPTKTVLKFCNNIHEYFLRWAICESCALLHNSRHIILRITYTNQLNIKKIMSTPGAIGIKVDRNRNCFRKVVNRNYYM